VVSDTTQKSLGQFVSGQANENVGEGPSRGLPRTSQSAPHIMTAPAKIKRRVIVIGYSLLKGTEGPVC